MLLPGGTLTPSPAGPTCRLRHQIGNHSANDRLPDRISHPPSIQHDGSAHRPGMLLPSSTRLVRRQLARKTKEKRSRSAHAVSTSSPCGMRFQPRRCRPRLLRCIHHYEPEQFYLLKGPDAPPPTHTSALPRSLTRVVTSIVHQPAVAHRPPPQSYCAIPSPLSAHTSKRSRAHDASTSAAADALYAHTLHTLQNRLSTLATHRQIRVVILHNRTAQDEFWNCLRPHGRGTMSRRAAGAEHQGRKLLSRRTCAVYVGSTGDCGERWSRMGIPVLTFVDLWRRDEENADRRASRPVECAPSAVLTFIRVDDSAVAPRAHQDFVSNSVLEPIGLRVLQLKHSVLLPSWPRTSLQIQTHYMIWTLGHRRSRSLRDFFCPRIGPMSSLSLRAA
ncbi:hypothetical protein C8J57DRAFT_1524602 [Mycena rebaudengoi]|nr:hypothetical protein C8J57DRAFT_1524602 [Mycena rebaudengoi]